MDAEHEQGRRKRLTRRRNVMAMAGLTLATAALLAACGGGSSSSSAPATTTGSSTTASGGSTTTGGSGTGTLVTNASQWLSSDSTARTAHLTLNAADGTANGGFNFNGYANGQMVVTIPTGWKVTVDCKNAATAVNHSCTIVKNEGDTTPAFPGHPLRTRHGSRPRPSATFDFTPTTAGDYRIECLVPDTIRPACGPCSRLSSWAPVGEHDGTTGTTRHEQQRSDHPGLLGGTGDVCASRRRRAQRRHGPRQHLAGSPGDGGPAACEHDGLQLRALPRRGRAAL